MQSPLPKPRVLLVDEERRTLRLAQAFLMQEYDVSPCESPQKAITLLQGEPFHVLVASHHLQTCDVFALAQQARSIQPHLPCLVISTTAHAHDPEMRKRNVTCLLSPYHPAALLDIMVKLVAQSEQSASHH